MARHRISLLTVTLMAALGSSATPSSSGAEGDQAKAKQFIEDHFAKIRPLEHASALAWWNANVSGKDEDFQAKEDSQNKLDAALSDKARFGELKRLKESTFDDRLLERQIEVLYLQYLEKQVDPELLRKITAKANAVEKAFNAYRAEVDGKSLSDSEVRKILKESKDSKQRQAVWEASKKVGAVVEADLKDLVKLRNDAAHALGYKDFHHLQLNINEQTQEEVLALFNQLDLLTRLPFSEAKADIDEKLAKGLGIKVEDLRPWHYQDPFFQESPAVYKTDLDSAYTQADILKLCREFYAGIGLPIDDVIARSDLYEKPGKSPHAFCTDIDRKGDVRVLANIVPNEYWMGTMLHELGHSVYSSKNIPESVPYVLRTESHILSTEGVAMMFERFSKDADWLTSMGVKLDDPKAYDEAGTLMRRNKLLIFSRWCQVMLRFEKELYAKPDQDLNDLWWTLVESYQGLKRPDKRSSPDYASKIHIVTAPAYYHNYMMGELFAAQVHHTIAREVLDGVAPGKASYVGKEAVGRFMKEKVFGPGRTLSWDKLTEHATGERLNPKAFAEDLKD